MRPENEFCILYQEMTRRTAAIMQESFIHRVSPSSAGSSAKSRHPPVLGAISKRLRPRC